MYVENVIPLSKLIGLLFLFCLPLLSILFLKTKRNDLARPVMGTIFLVILDLVKVVIKSQSRIMQYHLEFEEEPDVQSHSGCGLKLGMA